MKKNSLRETIAALKNPQLLKEFDSILGNTQTIIKKKTTAEERASIIPAAISKASDILDNMETFKVETLANAPEDIKKQIIMAIHEMKKVVEMLTSLLNISNPMPEKVEEIPFE